MVEISVIIPTRNRPESLQRLLFSLSIQSHKPKEVIVVDASDEHLRVPGLQHQFSNLPVSIVYEPPSVCRQRNIGIQKASSAYVFLCDDDIELPAGYLSQLCAYAAANPSAPIVSGWVLDKHNSEWKQQYPQPSILRCLWIFIFQLSVWHDFSSLKTNLLTKPLLSFLKKWYRKRGNTYSLAGWPLVTSFDGANVKTSFYTLSACLAKRSRMLEFPFDEGLSANGIGENYGITAPMPEKQPIHIVTLALALHHHAPENRLKTIDSYGLRIFALHYFMKKSHRFSFVNFLFFYWSLAGNILWQLAGRNWPMARATMACFVKLSAGRNPYLNKLQSQ